jgi:hypothetical protein
MWKKLKCSDGGNSGSNKCKQGYGSAYGGVRWSLCLARVWSQAVGLCWCVWQESSFSDREDVFTFNLAYKGIL